MLKARTAYQAEGMDLKDISARFWVRQLVVVAMLGCAAALRVWPLEFLHASLPWLTFLPVVVLAAFAGGRFSGLLALTLSVLIVCAFWRPLVGEPFAPTLPDWLDMSVFIFAGLVIAFNLEGASARARGEVLETLVKSMDEGFCVVEMVYDWNGKLSDYQFIEVNAAFESQTGLRDALNKTMRALAPDQEPPWLDAFDAVARTGEEVRFEGEVSNLGRYLDVFAFRIGDSGNHRIGILLRDISERKSAEQHLIQTARYDMLTGLPNRAMFEEYLVKSLARAKRSRRNLALFFLDLDGFKTINDKYGHQAGDEVLRIVSGRLLSCMRTGDFVSRRGGDEFNILVEDCPPRHLQEVAEKVVHATELPIGLGDTFVKVSCSIGIVRYPDCIGDADALVRMADAAMYDAKKNETRRYQFSRDVAYDV